MGRAPEWVGPQNGSDPRTGRTPERVGPHPAPPPPCPLPPDHVPPTTLPPAPRPSSLGSHRSLRSLGYHGSLGSDTSPIAPFGRSVTTVTTVFDCGCQSRPLGWRRLPVLHHVSIRSPRSPQLRVHQRSMDQSIVAHQMTAGSAGANKKPCSV
jgi:hypothetical protein